MPTDFNPIERTYRGLKDSGHEVIKLFSGNPNDEGFIFPPEILNEAYGRYFRNQTYHPHSKGLPEARRAIAAYYERQQAVVDPENIVLTAGTSESFFYLFSLLTQPGDNVLAPNPAYPLFDEIARLTHILLQPYHLREDRGWAIDLEDLKNATDERTRAIILISPHNPTGHVASRDEIEAVVEWANKKNLAIICDEVFCEFFYGEGSYPRPMAVARPNLCFTLNGLSKMFALPALKLGWIAVTGEKSRVDAAVDRLELTADTFLSCHTPIQHALPDLFTKGESFRKSYVAEVGRRREAMMKEVKIIPTLNTHEPIGGFYVMAGVAQDALRQLGLKDEEEFVIELMKREKVFVHPGYFFDYECGTHVILSFLTAPQKRITGIAGLTRLLNPSK